MGAMQGYRFTLPGYDHRGNMQIVIPTFGRIAGDDVAALYPVVADAAGEHGYRFSDDRWRNMAVEYVVGFDVSG